MQWDRAKNYMLAFFVAINIMLFVLIQQESSNHILTSEQEDAVFAIFAQNNINSHAAIPRRFSPMRVLQIAPFEYDTYRLISIFFPPEAEVVNIENTVQRVVYEWENMRLVISNERHVSFSNPSSLPGLSEPYEKNIDMIDGENIERRPNKAAAIALSNEFVQEHYPDFRLDIHSIWETDDSGLWIVYLQEYQGHLIDSNKIDILVTGDGDNVHIETIEMIYRRPIGFAYLPRELRGPHEALLTFVQHVSLTEDDTPTLITHMDIVYVQLRSAGQWETYIPIFAEPHYRIFVQGVEQPHLINAFTNQRWEVS